MLHQPLFNPIINYINDVENICIIPHKFLHNFPFHTIYFREKRKPIGLVYKIYYSPSSTILYFCRTKNHSSRQSFLGFGNPKTKLGLSNLPNSEDEVNNISKKFENPLVFFRENATKTNLYKFAPRSNLIHIACHGFFDPLNPLLSCLYFASSNMDKGILTATEIFNLRLENCNIVVLSACQSGRNNIIPGDEIVGLTRSFFFAGAPTLLVSLWQIDDFATKIFMEHFYSCLIKGYSKVTALVSSQDFLRKYNEMYKDPFFWGSFILVGDDQ